MFLVLAAGEPDFDTPQNIQEAAIKAMQGVKQDTFQVRDASTTAGYY